MRSPWGAYIIHTQIEASGWEARTLSLVYSSYRPSLLFRAHRKQAAGAGNWTSCWLQNARRRLKHANDVTTHSFSVCDFKSVYLASIVCVLCSRHNEQECKVLSDFLSCCFQPHTHTLTHLLHKQNIELKLNKHNDKPQIDSKLK